MLEGAPQSARLHSFTIRLHAALGNRAEVNGEAEWPLRSDAPIHEISIFVARVLLGDEDEAIQLALDSLAQRRVWVGEVLGCTAPQFSEFERLKRNPRYPTLIRELGELRAELLARYPID